MKLDVFVFTALVIPDKLICEWVTISFHYIEKLAQYYEHFDVRYVHVDICYCRLGNFLCLEKFTCKFFCGEKISHYSTDCKIYLSKYLL